MPHIPAAPLMKTMAEQTTLGAIIANYRKANKISMRSFASSCGLSKAYIGILERNERPESGEVPVPSLETIVKVANAIDMDSLTLMRKIGIDVKKKEAALKTSVTSKATAKTVVPFEYIPLTQENLNAAVRERRILLLPFPAPVVGTFVYAPMPEYSENTPTSFRVEKVDGGVYEAMSGTGLMIQFSLFDIDRVVYTNRNKAREKLSEMVAKKEKK